MKLSKRQQGMSFIGFMMLLGIGCFFAFIAIKLFPPYQEYLSVKQAMSSVQAQPGVSKKTPREIKSMLDSRFFASYVESVRGKDATIDRKNGNTLTMTYEVRIKMFFNIDVITKFDHTVDLSNR